MRTFLTQNALVVGERVLLSPEESSHALNSLRLGQGELVRISNGQGKECEGKIWRSGSGLAEVEILKICEPSKRIALHFLLAPLKGPKMDWLVEKLTELGVSDLQLLSSERTVARAEKLDRWVRLTEAAAKQSGNSILLKIHPILSLSEALATAPSGLKILLQPAAPQSLSALIREQNSALQRIILAIGPEGGFSPKEESEFLAAGYSPARMSSQILRGETAAIAAAAIAAHLAEDLK